MSILSIIAPHHHSGPFRLGWSSVHAGLRNWKTRRDAARLDARAADAIAQLNPHMLRDIGIPQGLPDADIPRVPQLRAPMAPDRDAA